MKEGSERMEKRKRGKRKRGGMKGNK